MRELTVDEMSSVSGGIASSGDRAAAAATAFLGMGLVVMGGPFSVGAALFYGASILSSGISIYSTVHRSKQ
ncbi:MAG: hypothetical protein KUG75_05130 [Pseudomonadales bacterium]|nr:hypothetical protein [Pseudomonadales bacterium]